MYILSFNVLSQSATKQSKNTNFGSIKMIKTILQNTVDNTIIILGKQIQSFVGMKKKLDKYSKITTVHIYQVNLLPRMEINLLVMDFCDFTL